MEYQAIEPISRQHAEAELVSGDWERISLTLVRLALHDDDPVWLEGIVLPYTEHENSWVRGNAAMCLGYIARLHARLNEQTARAALGRLLKDDDAVTRAKAHDALSDLDMFLVAKHRE